MTNADSPSHPGLQELLSAGRVSKAQAWLQEWSAQATVAGANHCNQLLQKYGETAKQLAHLGELKVAFLASFTSGYMGKFLQPFLLADGFAGTFYHGPYAQMAQEILNPQSGLHAFAPRVVVVAVEAEALLPFLFDFPFLDEAEALREKCANTLEGFIGLIRALNEKGGMSVLVHNFAPPAHRAMGLTGDSMTVHVAGCIGEANSRLRQAMLDMPGCRMVDYDHLQAFHGRSGWSDPRLRQLAKMPLSMQSHVHLAREHALVIRALHGRPRKCLVLDLDNTLWGGVIGEDGIDGLRIGGDFPGGAFLDFQRALLQLQKRGVLLALCSKNNEADALEVLRTRPEMHIKETHVAALRINWQDKAANIRELAAELNIGTDSMVFIDDSAHERALVRQMLPEVLVPEWPADPCLYADALRSLRLFETASFTAADGARGASYVSARQRNELRSSTPSLESYYRGLGMVMTVRRARAHDATRLAQLASRTNQFNLTGRRLGEAEFTGMLKDARQRIYVLEVRDRFEDSGATGMAVANVDGSAAEITDLMISCRVLGRTLEDAFLGVILRDLAGLGVSALAASRVPTKKNGLTAGFYPSLGMQETGAEGDRQRWRINPLGYDRPIPTWIEVIKDI